MDIVHKCVFCAQPLQARSKEHIFPRWLQKRLSLLGQTLYVAQHDLDGQIAKPPRKMKFASHVSGKVCLKCNTGWMNQLEGESRCVLIPLIEDTYEGGISYDNSQQMAVWLFKTALALHSTSISDMFIPKEHYEAIYNKKTIPSSVIVAIAHFGGNSDDLFFIQNRNWIGAAQHISQGEIKTELSKSYKITMRFGHLAARVSYLPSKRQIFEYESGIKYISHPRKSGVVWIRNNAIRTLQEFDESIQIVG